MVGPRIMYVTLFSFLKKTYIPVLNCIVSAGHVNIESSLNLYTNVDTCYIQFYIRGRLWMSLLSLAGIGCPQVMCIHFIEYPFNLT